VLRPALLALLSALAACAFAGCAAAAPAPSAAPEPERARQAPSDDRVHPSPPDPRGRGALAAGVPPRALRFAGPDPLAGVRLRTPARAGVAFDLDSGRVLWRRDARRPLPIASLSKVMTAMLVVERTRPRDVVRVPAAAWRVRGSRMGFLQPGRRVRVETLLHGLLMSSGNDAAVALATHVAGSERRFVARMNDRARRWGLTCTRFVTVHGLGFGPREDRGPANRSCAADLGELAVRAMRRPRVVAIARKRSARVRIGAAGLRWLATTNPLLRKGHPGVLGLKTGWTPRAGRCLIAVVEQGARRRVVVLLGAGDPARAAERLLSASARRLG
jgi:D-alanyl-D-alanine carboxypeptidase (penicillin-binding protein 5/6)